MVERKQDLPNFQIALEHGEDEDYLKERNVVVEENGLPPRNLTKGFGRGYKPQEDGVEGRLISFGRGYKGNRKPKKPNNFLDMFGGAVAVGTMESTSGNNAGEALGDFSKLNKDFVNEEVMNTNQKVKYSELFRFDFLKSYNIEVDTEAKIPRFGLINGFRNICFMNSVLQCLVRGNPFGCLLKFLQTNIGEMLDFPDMGQNQNGNMEEDLVIISFLQFLKKVLAKESRHYKIIDPRIFDSFLGKFAPFNSQEDAQEFLTFLFDTLHEELVIQYDPSEEINKPDSTETDEWQEVSNRNTKMSYNNSTNAFTRSPIQEIFGGYTKTQLFSKQSSQGSINFEPFFMIHLDIKRYDVFSISDAMQIHFTKDYIEGEQEGQTYGTQKTEIHELPHVLIIHITRFVFDRTKADIIKIHKNLEFEDNIMIESQWMSKELQSVCRDSEVTYNLYGIISHIGKGVLQGHYKSACRESGTEKWIMYDDENYNEIDEKSLHQMQPYLLFYQANNPELVNKSKSRQELFRCIYLNESCFYSPFSRYLSLCELYKDQICNQQEGIFQF